MNKRRIGMVAAMVCSLFLSSILNGTVFVAGTPRIRPDFNRYLARAIFLEGKQTLSPREQVNELYHRLGNVPFTNVTKGVYVKSEYATAITLYRINQVDWTEYTYEIGNKIYKFRVPTNVTPPAKKTFE